MYPAHFVGLFPPFPRDERVFVAMSFAEQFRARWEQVLVPAVEKVIVNGVAQTAHRVDARRVSDSILTEILEGITRARLVLADITAVGDIDGTPVRNANVMYEVGLAHALRLPEEVLLFRSDDRPLLFDVAPIRVQTYDPDGSTEAARDQVADTIIASLRELKLRRHLAVRRAASQLDYPSWTLLTEVQQAAGLSHPIRKTMGQVLGAAERADSIVRLLELGAIETRFVKVTPQALAEEKPVNAADILRYHSTPFGQALLEFGVQALGLLSPEVRAILERRLQVDSA